MKNLKNPYLLWETRCCVKCALSSLFSSPEIFRDSVFLGSQTLLICYGSLEERHWLLLVRAYGERCKSHVGSLALSTPCLSVYKEEQQRGQRWFMRIGSLKPLGSKVILLVTFSPLTGPSEVLSHSSSIWNTLNLSFFSFLYLTLP